MRRRPSKNGRVWERPDTDGEIRLIDRQPQTRRTRMRPNHRVSSKLSKVSIRYATVAEEIRSLDLMDPKFFSQGIAEDESYLVPTPCTNAICALIAIEVKAAGFDGVSVAVRMDETMHGRPITDSIGVRVPKELGEPLVLWAANPGLHEIRLREYLTGLGLRET